MTSKSMLIWAKEKLVDMILISSRISKLMLISKIMTPGILFFNFLRIGMNYYGGHCESSNRLESKALGLEGLYVNILK